MFKSFAARLSIVFFLSTALVLLGLFSFFYFKAAKLRDDAFKQYLENLTEASANLIPGEDVRAVPLEPGCETSSDGQALIKKLQSIRSVDKDVFDVYIMVPDPDPGFLRFVTNADRERTPVGCGERYDIREDPGMRAGFMSSYADMVPGTDKWGTWVSAYAPLKTRAGETVGILGIDIAQQTVAEIRGEFFGLFLLSMGVCLGLSLATGLLCSFWLTKPIRQTVKGMEIVAGGNIEHKLEHFAEAEFERMSGIFNRMTDSLKRMMHELAETVRENERVKRELEIASEIQESIFPARPPEVEGLEIEARSVPAKEVGGDYFDFLPVPSKDQTGFIIADASGKGLPGTLYMTRSRSVFRVISSEESSPGETLNRSNNYIAADASSGKGMFITVLYLIYDKDKKQMRYANAGHYHPLWYKGKERTFADSEISGIPLGIVSGQTYLEETIQLASQDLLVLYTDGVIEAKAEDGRMFGVEKLKKIIEENSSLGAHDLFAKIEAGIKEFIGKAPPFDDLTLIVIRVK
ncbi:MAG TPA: SpoIIE family protein phosphatase [Candidatus Omnitrophota bacterium]|nr:SpoIIE family protein phosphatase [Candidatus Omnitrophota bacterium]